MKILACFLCVILLFTLVPQTWAQQVSPVLLEAARQAYQQGRQDQRSVSHVWAATAQVSPASETDWNNLRQLLVGADIAVKTKDNIRHSGTFLAYSDEAISLRKGKREVSYPRKEVLRVSFLGPPNRQRGAVIGFSGWFWSWRSPWWRSQGRSGGFYDRICRGARNALGRHRGSARRGRGTPGADSHLPRTPLAATQQLLRLVLEATQAFG